MFESLAASDIMYISETLANLLEVASLYHTVEYSRYVGYMYSIVIAGDTRYTRRLHVSQSCHGNPLSSSSSQPLNSPPPPTPPAMALRLTSKRVLRSAFLPQFRVLSSAASRLPSGVQAEILVFPSALLCYALLCYPR